MFGPLFLLTHFPSWMAYPLGILAAMWILAVGGIFFDAWKRRASDLLLAEHGLTVRGGPLHKATHTWIELDPERCTTAREGEHLGCI